MLRLEYIGDNLDINSSPSNGLSDELSPVIEVGERQTKPVIGNLVLPFDEITPEKDEVKEETIPTNKLQTDEIVKGVMDSFIKLMKVGLTMSTDPSVRNILETLIKAEDIGKLRNNTPYVNKLLLSGRESLFNIDDWGFNSHILLLSPPNGEFTIYPFGDSKIEIREKVSDKVELTFEDDSGRSGKIKGDISDKNGVITINGVTFYSGEDEELNKDDLVYPLIIDWDVTFNECEGGVCVK